MMQVSKKVNDRPEDVRVVVVPLSGVVSVCNELIRENWLVRRMDIVGSAQLNEVDPTKGAQPVYAVFACRQTVSKQFLPG